MEKNHGYYWLAPELVALAEMSAYGDMLQKKILKPEEAVQLFKNSLTKYLEKVMEEEF